jgi:putative ABC transport system ATP-binding protein
VLALEGVARSFDNGRLQVDAVKNVDLKVGPGEFVSVVGKSGSGKSTVLHLAGGLTTPDRGRVLLDGEDLATMSAKQRAAVRRRRIGFVFQFFHLLPGLTVAENVSLPLLLDRRPADSARVDALLKAVGLSDRARHFPGELSGGEMQRAAIARALVAGADLILADEPTGNLDSATGADVLALLVGAVREADAALLMVTHDQGAAAQADRTLTLADGVVV